MQWNNHFIIKQLIYGKAQGGLLGAVLGATIGNTISDTIGAIMDPTMRTAVMGITLGCLIPIAFIPIIEWVRREWERRRWTSGKECVRAQKRKFFI